jgi:hypothetical protein
MSDRKHRDSVLLGLIIAYCTGIAAKAAPGFAFTTKEKRHRRIGPFLHDKAPTQASVLLDATIAGLRTGAANDHRRAFHSHVGVGAQDHREEPKQNFSWILSNAGKGRVKYEVGKGWCVDTDPAQPPPTESELIALAAAP